MKFFLSVLGEGAGEASSTAGPEASSSRADGSIFGFDDDPTGSSLSVFLSRPLPKDSPLQVINHSSSWMMAFAGEMIANHQLPVTCMLLQSLCTRCHLPPTMQQLPVEVPAPVLRHQQQRVDHLVRVPRGGQCGPQGGLYLELKA